MFKLQSLSKYSPFDVIHLLRCFSIAQNSFWTCQFWCLLVLLPFFVSPLPYWQNISLWGIFSLGELRWGTGVMIFLLKNFWTLSMVRAGVLVNHPSSNGQMHWKSLQRNSVKPNTASHNNASWYTDTDVFLEHSLSRGSLYYKGPAIQKIILFGGSGPPL